MQTVSEAVHLIVKRLTPLTGHDEARHFARLIFDYLRGYSRTDLILKETETLLGNEIEFIEKALERLKLSEPLQYVLGQTEFMGLTLKVDQRVLIPRPETEELVEWILSDKSRSSLSILDIGTGSGCIPIALKKHLPLAFVEAWDISPDALSLAGENALLNKTSISFKRVDVLNAEIDNEKFYDIVVSNPPYVTINEKSEMAENVLGYEPHLALFVANEAPLVFYDAIAKLSKRLLKSGGKLYFEINQTFGNEVVEMLASNQFDAVVLKKDLSGRDRMVRAIWPGVH